MQNSQIHRQRQNFTQQIRKTNREQIFSKKRNLNILQNSFQNEQIAKNVPLMQQQKQDKKIIIVDESRRQLLIKLIQDKYYFDQFNQLISNIHDPNIDVKHRGVIGIRKVISIDSQPPIQQVIDAQLVPLFIQMSKQSVYPQLQLEATWILTNVCSGTTPQCQSVIDKGGIPIFVQQLIQNKPGVVDQAVWAIGNLSGDCTKFRDQILKAGALQQLIKIVNSLKNKQLIRQIAWTISNLCRGTPLPKYDLIKEGIVTLCYIVKSSILDLQNLIDSLWAISYACQTQKSRIQRVVQTGIVPKLIQICLSQHVNQITPTLRILGNISVGNQLQTQQLLKHGILDLFIQLISHEKKIVRRQICWIISNITAGTRTQGERVLNNQYLMAAVLKCFQADANQVKREICYIFSNMVNMGDKKVIFEFFVRNNIVEYYARLLVDASEVKTLQVTLQTLYGFLSIGESIKQNESSPNVLVNQLVAIPGVADALQKLQYHNSTAIYNKTIKILQKYFDLQNELHI